MTDAINEILNTYHAADLGSMANEAGLLTLTTRGRPKKEDMAAIMRQNFFTPQRIKASYAKLNPMEKEVLNRVLLHTNPVIKSQLRRELVAAKLVTEAPQPQESARNRWSFSQAKEYEGSFTRKQSTVFEDVMARLTWHGLVFTKMQNQKTYGTPPKLRITPGSTLYIPSVVRNALPAPTPVPLTTRQYQPEQILPADPNRLLRDLYLYWDYARKGGIKLLTNGSVGKRELKVLNGLVLVSDPAIENARKEEEMTHLHLLRILLQSLGLLRATNDQFQPASSDPLHIPDFWRESTEEQMLACLRQWENAAVGPETVNLNSSDSPRTSHARQQLLHRLAASGESEWVSVDDLLENFWYSEIEFLYAIHAEVEESNRRYGSTFNNSYYYGDREKLLRAIEESERTFLKMCLDGSLFLLGLVDKGEIPPQSNTKTVYRLNEGGRRVVAAYMAGKQARVESVAPALDSGRILIQPNFHLVAMGPVPLAVLAQLDLFAVRLQVGVGAFEYELTRESVYQAQQNGLDVQQIRPLLVELCGGALPQNVDRTLSEWAQHQERIVFRSGVDLFHTGDPALLEKLSTVASVAAHFDRTLTPSLALLKTNSVDKAVAALKEEEQLPVLTDALPASVDKSIRLDENGTIHPLHPLPSLFLKGRLAKIAEPSNNGEWKLTQATVRRIGGSRTKINDLLAELGALSQSPLPAPLVERIKAWDNYYGQAGMAQVTIIEFQNRAVLDELLKVADLGKRLHTLDDKHALAMVNEKDVAPVKKTLERLGVAIKNGISHAGFASDKAKK